MIPFTLEEYLNEPRNADVKAATYAIMLNIEGTELSVAFAEAVDALNAARPYIEVDALKTTFGNLSFVDEDWAEPAKEWLLSQIDGIEAEWNINRQES